MKRNILKKLVCAGLIGTALSFGSAAEAGIVTDRFPIQMYVDHQLNTYANRGDANRAGYADANTDLIRVYEVSNGWAKVSHPGRNGTVNRWCKVNELFADPNYSNRGAKVRGAQQVYRTQSSGATIGSVSNNEDVIVLADNGTRAQIIYRLDNGTGYKIGWVPSSTVPGSAPVSKGNGDVNGDGRVTKDDVDMLLLYLQEKINSLPCMDNADVNGDGKVNIADTVALNKIVASQPSQSTPAYQQWTGYATKKSTAYTNAALTQRNGTEYVDAGDQVTVHAEQGNAYQVTYPTSSGTKTRWVEKSAISRNKPNPTPTYQTWTGYATKKSTAYTNAALTQRNGTEYVDAGDKVTVHAEQGNAYQVTYPTSNGGTKTRWVAKDAISRNKPNPAPTYQQWTGYATKKSTAYTNAALTQRNGTEYVDVGDQVTVRAEQGNAYQVTYPTSNGGTKTRWVEKSAISRNKPTPQPTPTFQQWTGYAIKKSAAYTNAALTQKNGTEYVAVGDTVTVKAEQGNAYQVTYPTSNGGTKTRWVAKSAISKTPPTINTNTNRNTTTTTSRGSTTSRTANTNTNTNKTTNTRINSTKSLVGKTVTAKRRVKAFDSFTLQGWNGVDEVFVGDSCVILKESGNAYQVQYPIKTRPYYKIRWVSKEVFEEPPVDHSHEGIQKRLLNAVFKTDQGTKVTCDFDGYVDLKRQYGYIHEGIDMVRYDGAEVYAVISGVITNAGSGYGNAVAIYDSTNNKTVVYLHFKSVAQNLRIGHHVDKGTFIGRQGATDAPYGSHVHIEVVNGRAKGPVKSSNNIQENDNPYSYWDKVL